ncbi:MAG: hypothetical protein R3Y64_04045 [Peptostreptococcaceae bacterium]
MLLNITQEIKNEHLIDKFLGKIITESNYRSIVHNFCQESFINKLKEKNIDYSINENNDIVIYNKSFRVVGCSRTKHLYFVPTEKSFDKNIKIDFFVGMQLQCGIDTNCILNYDQFNRINQCEIRGYIPYEVIDKDEPKRNKHILGSSKHIYLESLYPIQDILKI